jgi:hypothetical protein
LTTLASDLKDDSGIINTGTLNLTGDTNNNAIDNNNGILNFYNNVVNAGRVENGTVNVRTGADVLNESTIVADIYNMGKLTSNASDLTDANGLTNTGTLNLTGGKNENKIINANGTTNFYNNVVNAGLIENGTVNVTASGNVSNEKLISADIYNMGVLTSDAGFLTDTDGALTNTGTLNLVGGRNRNNIANNTGTTNIYNSVINSGKVSAITYGNKTALTLIVGEYGENTALTLKSLQSMVAKLQPDGYEAFASEYTELKETAGSGYTVSFGIPADVAQQHAYTEAAGYSYVTVVFAGNAAVSAS